MSVCDFKLENKLKSFYNSSEETKFAVEDFKKQVNDIFAQAERDGIDPVKMIRDRANENVKQIEMDAFRRMMQIDKYQKAAKFVEQFGDKKVDGVRGLFFVRHGEKHKGIGNLETLGASEKNRRIGIMKKELGPDADRIFKKFKNGDPDLELTVRKLEYGEIDQAGMGKIDPDAILLHRALKKLGAYDYKRKRLSGADVGFKKKRLHRQSHDPNNMREIGQTAWVNHAYQKFKHDPIIRRIEEDPKMVNKYKDSQDAVRSYLEDHYEKIIINESKKGMSIDDTFQSVQFMGQQRAMESRTFFEFKDAKSEFEYNREVNGVSLFENVAADIIRDSGTVASIELLGPNPNATFNKLIQEFGIDNADQIKKEFRFASGRKAGYATGMLARAASKARKLTDMSLLSTSLLSTLPDLSIGAYVISSKTGRNYFEELGRLLKGNVEMLKGKQRKEYMRRLNILMEDELFDFHRIGEDGKFASELDPFKSEVFADRPIRRVVEGVGRKVGGKIDYAHNKIMKLTGLPSQSQIMRAASVKNYAMYLSDMSGKSKSELYRGTKDLFDRLGIDDKDWDILRSKTMTEGPDGSMFMDPETLLDMSKEDFGFSDKMSNSDFDRYKYTLHGKVSGMYDFISNTSSPTPGVRSKAFVETIDPNTVAGVLMRTVAQYKSFSISVYNSLREGGITQKNRIGATAALMGSGISLAYIGLASKEAMKNDGEIPEIPYDDPKEMAKFSSMLLARSGTAGLMFDFLSTDYNSPWRSFAGDVMGPSPRVVEAGLGIAKYPLDMLMSRNEKERKKASRYFLNNTEKLMPSIPFTRAQINEKLFDVLHKSLNTGAKR